MTKFYIVHNWNKCYNIYSTRERAELACKKIIERALEDKVKHEDGLAALADLNYTPIDGIESLTHFYYGVFEVEEGETFGEEYDTKFKEDQNLFLS